MSLSKYRKNFIRDLTYDTFGLGDRYRWVNYSDRLLSIYPDAYITRHYDDDDKDYNSDSEYYPLKDMILVPKKDIRKKTKNTETIRSLTLRNIEINYEIDRKEEWLHENIFELTKEEREEKQEEIERLKTIFWTNDDTIEKLNETDTYDRIHGIQDDNSDDSEEKEKQKKTKKKKRVLIDDDPDDPVVLDKKEYDVNKKIKEAYDDDFDYDFE